MLWTRLATQKQTQKRTKQNKNPTNQQIKGLGRKRVSVGRRETGRKLIYRFNGLPKISAGFLVKNDSCILKFKRIYNCQNNFEKEDNLHHPKSKLTIKLQHSRSSSTGIKTDRMK